jgi:hypothetical protein
LLLNNPAFQDLVIPLHPGLGPDDADVLAQAIRNRKA